MKQCVRKDRTTRRECDGLAKLEGARARNDLLVIEGYCDSPDCPARESEISIKDFDGDLMAIVRHRRGLLCPVCGAVMKVHWVRTFAEHEEELRIVARGSVAREMYWRDHGSPKKLVAIPLSIFCDERLPPTPAGWWGEENDDGREVQLG